MVTFQYQYSISQQDNLFNYYKFLCDKLNETDIKADGLGGKKIEWKASQYIFEGGICSNYEAFTFIKQNGFLEIGICPHCGKCPIDDTYTYTNGLYPMITYSICKNCCTKGQKVSVYHNSRQKKEGCYIATACYGNYNASEIIVFREYRDNILNNNWFGKLFINLYYRLSPFVVLLLQKRLEVNIWLKEKILDKIYKKLKNRKN